MNSTIAELEKKLDVAWSVVDTAMRSMKRTARRPERAAYASEVLGKAIAEERAAYEALRAAMRAG
jgi:hypothetical protein